LDVGDGVCTNGPRESWVVGQSIISQDANNLVKKDTGGWLDGKGKWRYSLKEMEVPPRIELGSGHLPVTHHRH
jgi:hypothetical protein